MIPLGDLRARSVMYWLPPGGRDNGVFATMWVVLAELESDDATAVLDLLADADVGGYAVTPKGPHGAGCQHVYVDTEQYNRAVDVLMLFLRGR